MEDKMDLNYIEQLKCLLIGSQKNDEGFEVLLRLGKGIDEVKINKACNILEELQKLWESDDCIPKSFMELFLDFQTGCESSLGLYNEDVQIEIEDNIEMVLDIVRQIVGD